MAAFTEGKSRAPDHRCRTIQRCLAKADSPGPGRSIARVIPSVGGMEATGNLAMVMNVIGHTDVHTTMHYCIRCWIPLARRSIRGIYVTNRVHNELRVQ